MAAGTVKPVFSFIYSMCSHRCGRFDSGEHEHPIRAQLSLYLDLDNHANIYLDC